MAIEQNQGPKLSMKLKRAIAAMMELGFAFRGAGPVHYAKKTGGYPPGIVLPSIRPTGLPVALSAQRFHLVFEMPDEILRLTKPFRHTPDTPASQALREEVAELNAFFVITNLKARDISAGSTRPGISTAANPRGTCSRPACPDFCPMAVWRRMAKDGEA
jgi:hypothetical protein